MFALLRKIYRCGDLYSEKKKKILFQRSDTKGLCFFCFSAKLCGNHPLPSLFPGLSRTPQLTSFQIPHSRFPHHPPSPNTVIPDFIPPLVLMSPPLSLMCTNILHTRSCSSLHSQIDTLHIHPALPASEAESSLNCSCPCSFQATLLALMHHLQYHEIH